MRYPPKEQASPRVGTSKHRHGASRRLYTKKPAASAVPLTKHRWSRCGCAIALFVGLAFPPSAMAMQSSMTGDAAVESGRDALNGRTSFPWYDRNQDSLQRLDVAPPDDVAARKSKWEAKPPANWTVPDWVKKLLEATGWLLLGVVILAVVWGLVRAFGNMESAPSGGESEVEDSLQGDIDRVESLPFQLNRPQSDLLSEARRYYEAGDYDQAMIYLYSYQLVQLDRHHIIRLTKGKTNRQYLREVRSRSELWDVVRSSMVAFEDVYFGHHHLTRSRFESCWEKLEVFHQQLEFVPV